MCKWNTILMDHYKRTAFYQTFFLTMKLLYILNLIFPTYIENYVKICRRNKNNRE